MNQIAVATSRALVRSCRLPWVLLVLVLLLAAPAYASHYTLTKVAFVTAKERRVLGRAGVHDTATLLDWTATERERAWLAEETGIARVRLLAMAVRCDLMRVDGIGPTIVEVLVKAGVDGVGGARGLGMARADELLKTMRGVTRGTPMERRLPSEDELAEWIVEARLLRPVLQRAE